MNTTTHAQCENNTILVKTLLNLYQQSQVLVKEDFLIYGQEALIDFNRSCISVQIKHTESLLNASGEGIYGLDLNGTITFINPAALRILGCSDEENIIGQHAHSLFHHHYADGSSYPLEECPNYRTLHENITLEMHDDVFWRKDGTPIHVTNNSYPILDENNTCSGAVVFFRDITKEKQQIEYLRLAAAVFAHANEGIIITDIQGKIEHLNAAVTRITGYEQNDIIGNTPALFSSGRHPKDFYHTLWQSLKNKGEWQGEIWNRRQNGEVYPEWLSISALRNGFDVTHYIGVFSDITERKTQEEHIKHLAGHDALTNLPNRSALKENFYQLASLSERNHSQLAVLFLDLDRFKWINDSLGHPIGDKLLIAVSERVKSKLRNSDFLCRLGGDEFVILLPELATAREAQHVASKLLQSLSEPFNIDSHELSTSFSIGISIYPNDGLDFNILLKHADNAMYHAKGQGRNTYQFFNKSMHQAAEKRQIFESALRQAINNNEFTLHYQPQTNMQGKIVAAEALLRWHHPELGNVPPDLFIPLAEETGLIRSIGEWVLNEACTQLEHWNTMGLTLETLSVNVALSQLHDRHFVDRLHARLKQHNINPNQLMLEFTESQLAKEVTQLQTQLEQIQQLGVPLSIDDFGTGYSNLGQLKQLKVNQLKIDRSFIKDSTSNSEDKAIVNAIVQMAHSLNISTIAEGVETAEQWQLLESLHCDQLQGFHFHRPMLANDLTLQLQQRDLKDSDNR
jgi:diguanylate cyclase (GGDEF)-like protein/PAS domain S-box-containing protein